MPRDYRAAENTRRAKALRDRALARPEMGQPSEERASAAGPTSMGVKVRNASDDLLIEAFLRQKKGDA